MRSISSKIPLILIAILGFSLYLNSLNGKFIWDDEHLVKNNVYLKNGSRTLEVFATDIGAGSGVRYRFYRPLNILTYIIDHRFWSFDVRGYHLTSLLLHITAALLVYAFTRLLFGNKIISFLAGIFFVAHPAHLEAVAWISGRPDILSLIFMLLSFIFYIKAPQGKNALFSFAILLSYALALLSKENAIIFPALLLFYHYAFKKKVVTGRFLSIISLLFIYLAVRALVLGGFFLRLQDLAGISERLPLFFAAISQYVKLLVFPYDLHADYGIGAFSITDLGVLFGIGFVLLSSIYAFVIRKKGALLFFSTAWFFLALLPVSGIYPLYSYVGERYLYTPSVGFFLILAKILNDMYETKRLRIFAIALTVSLVSFYSFLTIRQTGYWKEPTAFYEKTLKYVPDSPTVNNNLGILYSETGRTDEAEKLYRKAILANPAYPKSYNNLGNIYYGKGDYEKAVRLYRKAIAKDPDYAEAYYNLANLYKDMRNYEYAVILYNKAIGINPNYLIAYNNLGGVYNVMGKDAEAIFCYEKALSIDPAESVVSKNLKAAYAKDR